MNALALVLAVALAADPAAPRADAPLEVKPSAVIDGMTCLRPDEVVNIGAGIAGLTAERDALRSRPPLWVSVVLVVAAAAVAATVTGAVVHETGKVRDAK